MEIFKKVLKPDPDLFFKKNDKSDPRLGEIVLTEEKDFDQAEIVILGSPQDEGVRRNNGRPGAAKAPDLIRKEFYKFPAQGNLLNKKVFDIGNISTSATLEEIHSSQKEVVKELIGGGKTLIVLGGGNDISYPDCSAVSEISGENLLAFNIDSHFDVRESSERNSGTPYRQLLEEECIKPENFLQIANKPYTNSDYYKKYLDEKGVLIYTLDLLRESGVRKLLNTILQTKNGYTVFWGFDMDSVRAGDAPGVSASYPAGLTAEEACDIASIAGENKDSKIFEISEVNPIYDIDNRTTKLAATLMVCFLLARS